MTGSLLFILPFIPFFFKAAQKDVPAKPIHPILRGKHLHHILNLTKCFLYLVNPLVLNSSNMKMVLFTSKK